MIQSRCGLLCAECTYKEPCNCKGCMEQDGKMFWGECPVASCCQSKGHEHCGQCDNLPCEQLTAFSHDKEHGDNPPGKRIEQVKAWRAQELAAQERTH